MIIEQIRSSLAALVKRLVDTKVLPPEALTAMTAVAVERPKNPGMGDYAINLALLLAKSAKMPPLKIAGLLQEELQKDPGLFQSVLVAPPGFINVKIAPTALSKIIPEALRTPNYGATTQAKPEKVLVEFVSANPTGGLHLGHARPAFVGDAVARLLSAAGFLVTREYYVNDAGNQIETLARTIHKRYLELFGHTITIEPGEYPAAYVIDIAKALKQRDGEKWVHEPESAWLGPISVFGVEHNLDVIKATLAGIDIKFDEWFSEYTLHQNGSLEQLFELFQSRGMLYEASEARGTKDKVRREDSKAAKFSGQQEGGWFLRTSDFGDEEDRIIRRKDGRFVYMTADLSYHHQKYLRGFERLIDVFGADHAGHIDRLRASMQALGNDPSQLSFVVVQMVRLIKSGQEVKFSKRAGEVYSLTDLVDEIGKDAARFVFLMRSPRSQFDLDLDLLKKQSNDNPVFYVQYAHARLATILAKAEAERGLVVDGRTSADAGDYLVLPEEREMLMQIAELPEAVRGAALALEPHRLITFCTELVRSFHSYFTKYRNTERIISDDIPKTMARLALVQTLKLTLANALNLLGISAPDRMEVSDASDSEDGA
jgi:arginyl-tRNA synthetase